MSELSQETSNTIYQEMLAHPVLYSHRHPQTLAIIGEPNNCILEEVLKHTTITEAWQITPSSINIISDLRCKYYSGYANAWAPSAMPDYFDICIITENSAAEIFSHYFKTLNSEGILLQLCHSPFDVQKLKQTQNHLFSNGFCDIAILSFPQPNFPSGWRCAVMAKKTGVFKKIREKDIFNKTFTTLYYNFDIHKAALAMPEFMRQELTDA